MNITELAGHKVSNLYIGIEDNGDECLKFVTDKGTYVFPAYGDCCSESWFYSVNAVEFLLGHTINLVDEISMGVVDDGITKQEVDELYKITITTEAGNCDIEFRNSSNGYYGGWIGDSDIEPVEFSWTEITTDWIYGGAL